MLRDTQGAADDAIELFEYTALTAIGAGKSRAAGVLGLRSHGVALSHVSRQEASTVTCKADQMFSRSKPRRNVRSHDTKKFHLWDQQPWLAIDGPALLELWPRIGQAVNKLSCQPQPFPLGFAVCCWRQR